MFAGSQFGPVDSPRKEAGGAEIVGACRLLAVVPDGMICLPGDVHGSRVCSKKLPDLLMVELSRRDKVVSVDYPLTRGPLQGPAD